MWSNKEDKQKIAELEKQIFVLKDKIEKQNKEVDDDMSTAEFEMDFEAIDALSVERILYGNKPITVIGFVRNRDKKDGLHTGQWQFHCSVEEHNKIVKKFREYIKSKKEK